jgi:DNA polymerase sigma
MPMIKLEIEGRTCNRVVHVTMLDRSNNSGRAISCFILEQKKRYPILQPIFYVIKYLTYHYKLSEPKNGGLKTYALVIMLLSCIAKWNEADPGKLLVDFLYYFGFYY